MNSTKTTVIVTGISLLTALPSLFAGGAGIKFKQMDANGDGRITREEHAAVALAAFDNMDADRDGVATAAEVAGGQEQKVSGPKFGEKDQPGGAAPAATARLSRADRNGDGQITRAEQQADADLVFASLDTNKDGVITESELAAAPTPVKAEKPKQPMEVPGRRN